jgi:hypothetical protein
VALRTVIGFLREHPQMERVRFALRSEKALQAFEKALGGLESAGS